MRTTLFECRPEHDGRDHGAYPLPYLEYDATIPDTQDPADTAAVDIMQFGLAFRASKALLSAAGLDRFTELAVRPLDGETQYSPSRPLVAELDEAAMKPRPKIDFSALDYQTLSPAQRAAVVQMVMREARVARAQEIAAIVRAAWRGISRTAVRGWGGALNLGQAAVSAAVAVWRRRREQRQRRLAAALARRFPWATFPRSNANS
jgi:hypothetical protein